MTIQIDAVTLLNNPETVDQLLQALNKAAREHDHYEYGLPLHDDATRAQMREIVYRWAASTST